MTRVAPVVKVLRSSQAVASKLGEANWRTRLVGVRWSWWVWVWARLVSPVWETTTPFGVPVEPEV
jgi:hypothetical protein